MKKIILLIMVLLMVQSVNALDLSQNKGKWIEYFPNEELNNISDSNFEIYIQSEMPRYERFKKYPVQDLLFKGHDNRKWFTVTLEYNHTICFEHENGIDKLFKYCNDYIISPYEKIDINIIKENLTLKILINNKSNEWQLNESFNIDNQENLVIGKCLWFGSDRNNYCYDYYGVINKLEIKKENQIIIDYDYNYEIIDFGSNITIQTSFGFNILLGFLMALIVINIYVSMKR